MIKGLSSARRMPRIGSIHLGIKKTAASGKEYPSEVSYFVCPPEVQAVFGEQPTALRIMCPVEDPERFFPQFYKRYTVNLLQCKGDGEKANCWAEDGSGLKEIPCPCDFLKSGECKQVGILQFLMPDVQGFGVWQITTSSKNSIIDLNSGLDMVRAIAGRIRMIPLILKREKMEMQRMEGGKPKKSTHYTLKIDIDDKTTLRQLQESAQVKPECVLLPPADETKDDLIFPEKNGGPIDAEVPPDVDGESKEGPPETKTGKDRADREEDLDGSANEEETLWATNSQQRQITEAIAALAELDYSEEEIISAMLKRVKDNFKRTIADTTELSKDEAERVIAFLKNWAESTRRKIADRKSRKKD